jgi:hypothetical protein
VQEGPTAGPVRPPYGPKSAGTTRTLAGIVQASVTPPDRQTTAAHGSSGSSGSARSAKSEHPQPAPAPHTPGPAQRARRANAAKRNSISEGFAEAKEMTARAAHDIRHQYGERLTRDECLKLLSVFRAGLVPRRRAGRRPQPQVTAAYLDWKTGIRGVALFRKHIPGWQKHNRYRRIAEEKRLMDAIRSRYRRERDGTTRLANGGAE